MEGELVYASFTGTNYDRFFLTLSDLGIAGSAKLVYLLCYLVLIGSFSACAKSWIVEVLVILARTYSFIVLFELDVKTMAETFSYSTQFIVIKGNEDAGPLYNPFV